jgi:hypothetical protein
LHFKPALRTVADAKEVVVPGRAVVIGEVRSVRANEALVVVRFDVLQARFGDRDRTVRARRRVIDETQPMPKFGDRTGPAACSAFGGFHRLVLPVRVRHRVVQHVLGRIRRQELGDLEQPALGAKGGEEPRKMIGPRSCALDEVAYGLSEVFEASIAGGARLIPVLGDRVVSKAIHVERLQPEGAHRQEKLTRERLGKISALKE